MPDAKPSLLKSAGTVGLMTLLSRITGVVTRTAINAHLGAGPIADAFAVAYRLPNLLRRFTAEGTMTSAFLPTLSEVESRDGERGAQVMVARFIGTLAFTLTLLTVVMLFAMGLVMGLQMLGRVAPGAPLAEQLRILGAILGGRREAPEDVLVAIHLGRIMYPYLTLVSVTAGMAAVLNLRHRFALPASVTTFGNLAFVGFTWLMIGLSPTRGQSTVRAAFWLALATLISGIVQLVVLIPTFRQLGFGFRWGFHWKHEGVRTALKRMGPGILGTGIYPINVFISTILASQLAYGAQTVLYTSTILSELVLGLFSASIATVSLPTMSRQVDAGDLDGVRDSLATALRGTAVMLIPASVGLAVLATPITAFLFRYGRFDAAAVDWTARTLIWQAVGILFIAAGRIVTQCLYALKDYRTPALASLVGVGANILFTILLMGPMDTRGVSLANALAALVSLGITWAILHRRLTRLPTARILDGWLRFTVGGALMGLLVWILGRELGLFQWHGRLHLGLRLFPLMGGAGLVYFGLLFALKAPEARGLWQILARKLRPGMGN